MSRGRGVALLAAVLLVAAAASTVSVSAVAGGARGVTVDTVTIRDDAGRVVRFTQRPQRIVSLVPAVTELLFALDAGGRVVGRTRYGVHPEAARAVPSVGEGVRPSLEPIVARSPDAVLLFAGTGNRGVLDRLEDLGVPVVAVRHDGFDDLARNLDRLGRLTGREPEAEALMARIRCELDSVAAVAGRRPRVSVYYEVWGDPPVTVGSGSYLDSLITLAGGRNVFGDVAAPSPTVGLEAIVARDPDVIVHAATGDGVAPRPARRAGWEALEAVRLGRVRTVDADLVHRLGPRVGRAAARLATALHPSLRDELTRERLLSACDGVR